MVAIVSGNSLGLFNTSASILGGAGILGHGMFGQAGGRAYVNAATGNLTLQFQDEQLSGRGADLLQLRTYNSRGEIVGGEFTDGDGDGWRWDGERTVKFDAAQDRVIRTAADGSETTYTRSGSLYVSTDGDGAHDFIQRDGAQWVWTDGSSRLEERYSDSTSLTMIGRLQTQKDSSGNLIDFEYSNNRLFRITDHDSRQRIELTYAAVSGGFTRLTRVDTFELNVDGSGRATGTLSATPLKQVEYIYNNGRLETVKTVLDPSATPLTYYTTTYSYADATTKNIASITQSDGTRVDFEYYADGRIKSVTDGQGKQSFTYNTNNSTDIRITDAAGGNEQLWTYTYDAATKQLLKIESPAPVAGAPRLVTRFEYESTAGHTGNVAKVVDARGNEVVYKYDEQGNRITERDSLGNTITRSYNSQNQLETESRYKSVDTNFTDNVPPSDPLTTRYVYDEQSRLRFVVSAEGRVQEYRYGAGAGEYGLLTRTIQYAGARYGVGTLTPTQVPTLAQLVSWVAGQDKTQVEQSQYVYDFRGNLATRIDFATVNTAGEGVSDDPAAIFTDYIYDAHSALLQMIARRGATRTTQTILTSYAYDGLGRLTSELNAGGARTTAYDGVARTIQVTNAASGLVETRTYDVFGRLSSLQLSGGAPSPSNPTLRTTQYVYDAFGRVRMVQDALGARHFSFYDAVGRLQQQVDSTGAACSYEYDANGQMTAQTCYAQPISAAVMSGWVSADGTVNKSTLSVGASGTDIITDPNDRVTSYLYDAAGRLTEQLTQGPGAVSAVTTYDGASRVTTQSMGNRVTRYFYDRDGHQVGVVDALGYLSEYKFDAAGRLVESVRYSTRSPLSVNASAPVWVGITAQTMAQSVKGDRTFTYRMPAFDPDGDPLTFRAVGTVPAWLSVQTSGSGGVTLTGIPPASFSSYDVVVEASDGTHVTSASVHITVTIDNHGPQWPSVVGTQQAFTGELFSLTLPAAVDPDNQALTYSIVQKPAWLSFNASTRELRGTPPAGAGSETVIVQASDPLGATAPMSFELKVAVNHAPTWAPLPATTMFLGFFNDYTPIAAVDADGDTLTYSVVSGLPAGLAMIDATTGRIVGDPGASGDFTVVLRVTDAHGAAVQGSVVIHAVAVGAGMAGPTQSAALGVLPPLEDVLSAWRPTATVDDLHGYQYYDAQGRLVGSVDERGFLSEFVYDEQAHTQRTTRYQDFVTVGSTDTLTDLKARAGIAQSTTIEYDGLGRVSRTFAVDGTITRNEYDSAGRLVREIEADATSEARASRIRYNVFGEVTGTLGGVGDAALSSNPALGLDEALNQYGVRYDYDSLGRRIRAIEPANPDGSHNLTLYYYDSESRLTHTINAKGDVSVMTYNAFGQLGEEHRYARRLSEEQLTFLTDPANGGGGGAINDTVAALLATVSVPGKDRRTLYEYDSRGLLTKQTDGEDFLTTNHYNAFGELAQQVRTILQAAAGTAARTVTTQFDYDLRGELLSTTGDAGGINFNAQSVYDAFGRVIASIDAAGSRTKTDYEDSGRTIVVTTPLSDTLERKVRIEYDAYARVTKQIRFQFGGGEQVTSFAYHDDTRSMSVTTPEGITFTTNQTVHGQTLSVVDGRGTTTAYEYDADGNVTRATQITAATADTPARTRVLSTNTYDTHGRMVETRDARGVLTRLTYDQINRVAARRVDPDGLNLLTTYQYNALGDQLRVTEGTGNNVGPNGLRVTDYKYDRDGRLTQVILDPDHPSEAYIGMKLTTTFSYDGLGNTVEVARGTVDAPQQQVTRYEFDNLGRLRRQIAAPTSVFGEGDSRSRDLTTEYRYDVAGRVSRSINANGESTRFVYDAAGQLTHTLNAEGEVSQNFYDANGQVVRTLRYGRRVAATTLASLGDVVSASTVTLAPDGSDQRCYYVYDKDGHQRYALHNTIGTSWAVSENRYDANSNVIEVRHYDKTLTDLKVSALDNADGITVADTVGALAELGYSSAESSLVNIQRTRFAYDADNRVRFTIDALGGVTENAYDIAGNLVTQVRYATKQVLTPAQCADEHLIDTALNGAAGRANANNQVTRFVYDAAGRRCFTVDVLASDASGQATQQRVSEQRYDVLGRVIQTIGYASVLGAMADTDYTVQNLTTLMEGKRSSEDRRGAVIYDAVGRQVYAVQALSLSTAGVPNDYRVTHMVYDSLGQVIQSTRYASAMALGNVDQATLDTAVGLHGSSEDRTTFFAYDMAGRQRFVIAADGALSETVYDALGQVSELRQFAQPVDPSVLTDATLRTDKKLSDARGASAVGDGVTRGERYSYDHTGRLLKRTDAGGFFETYTYDAFGSRKTFTNKLGGTWTYTYDRVGRLRTQVAPPVLMQLSSDSQPTLRSLTAFLEYDTFGNLLRRTEANGTADARLTSYEYDRLGRQTKLTPPGWYDPATGQVERQSAAGRFQRTVETVYDALGNTVRVKIQSGANANDFINQYHTYDALGRVVHDIDALNHVTAFTYNLFGEQKSVTRHSVTISGTPASDGFWRASEIAGKVAADSAARTIVTSYDNLGRKSEVRLPSVASYFYSSTGALSTVPGAGPTATPVTSQAITRYDYNVFGEVTRESVKLDDLSSADPRGGHWRDTWHYFDVRGRETRTIDAAGYHSARSYDALGNPIEITEYANAGSPGSLALTPPATPANSDNDRITHFVYNALNQQTSVLRKGLRYSSWNGSGYTQVANSRDSATEVASMSYDGLGHVLTQRDALGNVTSTTYNQLGQVTTVTEPARVSAQVGSVDPFLNRTAPAPVTSLTLNGFGQVVVQVRDAGAGAAPALRRLITVQQYDVAGNLISSTDANHVSLDDKGTADTADDVLSVDHRYDRVRQYDYAGRVIKERQGIEMALGHWTMQMPDNSQQIGHWQTVTHTLERRYGYDATGQQTDVLDVYLDDANVAQQSGRRSVFNAFGEVSEEQRIWGTADMALTALEHRKEATYNYDNAGHLLSKSAADGLTQYLYNLAGQVTRQEQRDNNASNDADSGGLLATRVTEIGYDVLGRATLQRLPAFRSTEPFGGAAGAVLITPFTEQSYDRWGNVVSRSQGGFIAHVADGDVVLTGGASTVTYEYNHDNQMIAEHAAAVLAYKTDGTNFSALMTHVLRYDLMGRAVQELDRRADDPVTAANEAGILRIRSKEYDAAGQLTAQTDGTNSMTGTGIRTEYAYDAHGNKVGTRNALGTVYVDTFDRNGNVLSHSVLRLANGSAYFSGTGLTPVARVLQRYEYDQANRRVGVADVIEDGSSGTPLSWWTYTQYDERNLVRATAQVEEHLLSKPFETLPRVTATYRYDRFGNKTFQADQLDNEQLWSYSELNDYSVARLDSSTVGNRSTQYRYNDFGQLRLESYTDPTKDNPSDVNERRYGYHDNGLLKDLVDHLLLGTLGQEGGIDYQLIDSQVHYEYTAKGELAQEAFTRTEAHETGVQDENGEVIVGGVVTLPPVSRTVHTVYDALGRVSSVSTPTGSNALDSVFYQYDEFGNRRAIIAFYTPAGATQIARHEQWYEYDLEGRVLIDSGELQDGHIVAGKGGTHITYDNLGRRLTAETFQGPGSFSDPVDRPGFSWSWDAYHKELYSYDDLGFLSDIQQQLNRRNRVEHHANQTTSMPELQGRWVEMEHRGYDVTGNMTSRLVKERVKAVSEADEGDPLVARTITSGYLIGGRLNDQQTIDHLVAEHSTFVVNTYQGDYLTKTVYRQGISNNDPDDAQTTYTYDYTMQFGGFKQSVVVAESNQPDVHNGTTTNQYDQRGNLTHQMVFDPSTDAGHVAHERFFTYDSEGRILTRHEEVVVVNSGQSPQVTTGDQGYFYAGGQQVATLGAGTLATVQFNNTFTPISDMYPLSSPGNYVVNLQDTLAGIAQTVYGDAQLWYLIADANGVGFGPTDPLPPTEIGKTYRIPNVVGGAHNNADTFKPYNVADIIGSGTPAAWIPAPPPSQCGLAGRLIAIAVIVAAVFVVAAATQGAATSALEPLGASLSAGLGAGLGAAAGSAAGQGVAVAIGAMDESSFSGRQVLAAGIAGGVTKGFGLGKLALPLLTHLASGLTGTSVGADSLGQMVLQASLQGTSGGAVAGALGQLAVRALDPRSGVFSNHFSWDNFAVQATAAFTSVAAARLTADWADPRSWDPEPVDAHSLISGGPLFADAGTTRPLRDPSMGIAKSLGDGASHSDAVVDYGSTDPSDLIPYMDRAAAGQGTQAQNVAVDESTLSAAAAENYVGEFWTAVAGVRGQQLAEQAVNRLVKEQGPTLVYLDEIISRPPSAPPGLLTGTADYYESLHRYQDAVRQRNELLDAYNPGIPHASAYFGNYQPASSGTAAAPPGDDGSVPQPPLFPGLPANAPEDDLHFTAIGDRGAGNGKILVVGGGSGGKALTAARLNPEARVHVIDPIYTFNSKLDGQLPRGVPREARHAVKEDPKAAARITWERAKVQDLTGRGEAGTYSEVHLSSAIPYVHPRAVPLHSMDMVAPGGQLHLQTEAPGIYKVTRGLMEEQGWVILDFTEGGEPTVRTFVPSSISAFGESDIFGRENAGNYDHGLIGVKPSPSARVPDAQSGFGVDPTGHAVTGGVYGAMTVLHGVQTDNPYLIAGGLSQTVSGGLSLAGEAAGSQFLRTAGSRAGWLGFAITASVVAGDVYNDFTSGDGLEQINGLLKIAGMVHPLGFVGQQGYDWVVHQGPQVMGQWNHGIHNVFGVPYY